MGAGTIIATQGARQAGKLMRRAAESDRRDVRNAGLILAAVGGAAIAARWAYRRSKRISFRDRVVLITGGSRGLGLVMARQLVREGARVAICARDEEELARALHQLRGFGGEAIALVCDVTQRESVERMIEEVRTRLGPVEALINNAGVMRVGPVETMTDDDFRHALDAHVWGVLHTTSAVLPDMRRRRDGRIMNISSIGGRASIPHLLPYCTSKFALYGLSEGLRAELARSGIRVTTVCPGLMRTGSPFHAEFKGRHRSEYAWFSILDSLPLLTMDSERAAAKALDAFRHGDGCVTLSLPAKALALAAAVAPGLTGTAMAVTNRLLPGPGGIGGACAKGSQSGSRLAPSALTRASDRAAVRNNEIVASERG